MQMQELNEIAASMEIMGKAYLEISKKMKNIKVRTNSNDNSKKRKRTPTAYNCFVKSQVTKGANMKDIMSTLGSKWKELSAEEKQVYIDESKKTKQGDLDVKKDGVEVHEDNETNTKKPKQIGKPTKNQDQESNENSEDKEDNVSCGSKSDDSEEDGNE